MAGFGEALTKVGAQFLELINKIEIDNQLSEFEGVTTEQINSSISEFVNDPEPSTYLERFEPQLEAIQKENLEKIKNHQARRIAENWFKRKSAGWQKQVQSLATGRAIQNTKDAIDLAEFRAIQQREPEIINRPVTRAVQNGVIGEAEGSLIIEQTHYKILLGQIEDEAWQTIQAERAKGVEVGLALSRGLATIEEYRGKVKNVSDLNQISTKVERSFFWSLSGEIAKEEETKAKSRDNAVELIEDPETTYDDIEILNLDEEEKEKVRKAKDVFIKKGPATTDAEGFNKLIGRVLDFYTDPKISGEVDSEILDAFYNRSLSGDDRKIITEYIGRPPYPTGIVGALTDAYQYGLKNIPAWIRIKGKDQERIAAYNKAMFDWLAQKTDKDGKLTVTHEDIYKESRLLAQQYKNLTDEEFEQWEGLKSEKEQEDKTIKTIDDVSEPKDRREFINKLRSLQKTNPDLSLEYYNKYLDKFY